MKLRPTTPASTSFVTKSVISLICLATVITVPLQISQRASADQYDSQIATLQREIDKYNEEAAKLSKQANTLQSKISGLQRQANMLQNQIDLSQAKYNKLVKLIKETEQKIKNNQDALGKTIADLYIDDKITPIEMLASSKNISDYMDKQEYRSSVRNELTATISEIKKLKKQLDKQKVDVKSVLDKQKAQRSNLAATQSQQQSLLNQTKGQESAYQQLAANNKQKLLDVSAQQRAYYQSLLNSGSGVNSGVIGSFQYANWSGNMGCGSDGYPYCGGQDTYSDPWALLNRECVSYAAWALSARFGKQVLPFNGSGNAYEWVWSAPQYSGAYRVSSPQRGDAVVLPANGSFSPLGHLMIVESVNGSWVHVSQYNFYGTGEYSTMDIKTSGVVFLRFQNG